MSPERAWLSPLSVMVTFVVVPVIPDTLIAEGYGEAAVGAGAAVLIVIGELLEKTTSGTRAFAEVRGRMTIKNVRVSTKMTDE